MTQLFRWNGNFRIGLVQFLGNRLVDELRADYLNNQPFSEMSIKCLCDKLLADDFDNLFLFDSSFDRVAIQTLKAHAGQRSDPVGFSERQVPHGTDVYVRDTSQFTQNIRPKPRSHQRIRLKDDWNSNTINREFDGHWLHTIGRWGRQAKFLDRLRCLRFRHWFFVGCRCRNCRCFCGSGLGGRRGIRFGSRGRRFRLGFNFPVARIGSSRRRRSAWQSARCRVLCDNFLSGHILLRGQLIHDDKCRTKGRNQCQQG